MVRAAMTHQAGKADKAPHVQFVLFLHVKLSDEVADGVQHRRRQRLGQDLQAIGTQDAPSGCFFKTILLAAAGSSGC